MLIPFSPAPGLNSDDTSFKAQGRWSDCDNVRFVAGAPEVIGSYKKLFAAALTGTCHNMFAFNRSGSLTIAYGTNSRLYVGTGAATPADRSPAGLGSSYTSWSFGEWGSTLLASPGGGTLYAQSGSSAATEVTQAPDRITKMLVTPQRQVLALGCNEEVSGTFNGLCIRWCDLEDYTDWTTTSTNNAGEHILEGPGVIVSGIMVGEYPAILTGSALYFGQYLGDPGQTYRFERVAAVPGPVGVNAITTLSGVLYWLGEDFNVWAWAPGRPPARVPCPVSKNLRHARPTSAANLARIHMHSVSAFGEIWLHVSGGAEDGYWAFAVETGTWFKGNFLRYAALDSGALSTVTSDGAALIMAEPSVGNSFIYEHEMLEGVAAEGPTSWFIQSAGQYFDNSGRRMLIRSFRPDWNTVNGEGPVSCSLTLTVRDHPASAAVTKGPYTLSSADAKKDFRASGKIVTVRLSAAQTGGRPRLGKALFDVAPLGER